MLKPFIFSVHFTWDFFVQCFIYLFPFFVELVEKGVANKKSIWKANIEKYEDEVCVVW